MSAIIEELAGRMEKEGEKAVAFFRDLPKDTWGKQVYTEGASWTVLELFTHVVEAEDSVARLITNIVNGSPGVPEDFDLDRYNEYKVSKAGQVDAEGLLNTFIARRARTVELIKSLSEDDLNTRGNHPFLGNSEIIEMLKLMYLHVQLHIRDVKKVIRQG